MSVCDSDSDSASEEEEQPPPKRPRLCVVKPRRPPFPENASPLYAFFVPNGAPANGLEEALGREYMTTFDEHFYMNSEESQHAREEAGRMIDLLMLARTCRHAFANIKVDWLRYQLKWRWSCFQHNTFTNTFMYGDKVNTVLWPYTYERQFARSNRGITSSAHELALTAKTRAAILAAFLGRPRVADLVRPPSLVLNSDAIALLGEASPRCLELDGEHFVRHPLIWVEGAHVRHPKYLQYYWWLVLTYRFKVPGMGPAYLRACATEAGLKILRCMFASACCRDARPYVRKIASIIVNELKGKARTAFIDESLMELEQHA